MLQSKHHYFRVISLLQKALRPYRNIRFSDQNIPVNMINDEPSGNFPKLKCKWFYEKIVKQKTIYNESIDKWSNLLQMQISFSKFYENKLQCNFELKISEFNYKLINFIIPTAYNLYKWKIKESELCFYCKNDVQNEHHMFYECASLEHLWNKIGTVFKVNIMWYTIITGINLRQVENKVVSLVCYIIYKKYLADTNGKGIIFPLYTFLTKELSYRLQIYDKTCSIEERYIIKNIVDILE